MSVSVRHDIDIDDMNKRDRDYACIVQKTKQQMRVFCEIVLIDARQRNKEIWAWENSAKESKEINK